MKLDLKRPLLALALLSVPLTLYAVYTESYFATSYYGQIGSPHHNSGYPSFAVGFNNALFASGTVAFGTNLQAYDSNSLVVGANNLPLPGSELLIVGNGTGTTTSQRRNLLEVMADGTVNIPAASTNSKLTIGTAATSGATTTTKIYGTADIDRVPAKGGISMGAYTAQ
jgi:hypothetical protein